MLTALSRTVVKTPIFGIRPHPPRRPFSSRLKRSTNARTVTPRRGVTKPSQQRPHSSHFHVTPYQGHSKELSHRSDLTVVPHYFSVINAVTWLPKLTQKTAFDALVMEDKRDKKLSGFIGVEWDVSTDNNSSIMTETMGYHDIPFTAPCMRVHAFEIFPEYRGKGLSYLLWQGLLNRATQLQINHLIIEPLDEEVTLFYEKTFKQLGIAPTFEYGAMVNFSPGGRCYGEEGLEFFFLNKQEIHTLKERIDKTLRIKHDKAAPISTKQPIPTFKRQALLSVENTHGHLINHGHNR